MCIPAAGHGTIRCGTCLLGQNTSCCYLQAATRRPCEAIGMQVTRCLSTIDHLNEHLIQNLVRLRGSCIPCALECHKGEHRL